MISSPLKTQFEAVLDTQHLVEDLPTLVGPDYFDEVPLFSRYQQVEFLEQFGDVNLLLVELSLDYLDRLVSAAQDNGLNRFAAITIISDDGGKHLVPQIFVCNGDVERRLADLHLSKPKKGLGKQVQELVDQARPQGGFSILEDRLTVLDEVRVFVGYASPPHGFTALEEFTEKLGNK